MKKIFNLILIAGALFYTSATFAADPPPPGDPPPQGDGQYVGDNGGGAPIGGGIAILLSLGAAWGGRKVYQAYHQTKE